MIRIPRFLAAMAIALPGAFMALPSAAQDTDSYDHLARVLTSDAISDEVFRMNLVSGFVGVLRQDPNTAQLENECPGLIEGLTDAVEPIMLESHIEGYAWYRSELNALFRRELSESDAQGAADFWGSEFGQNVLISIAKQHSVENTVEEALETTGPVSEEAYAADKAATVERVMENLNQQDLERFSREMAGADWFPAFQRIRGEVNALSLNLVNRDFTPSQGKQFDRAVDDFYEAHFASCDAGK